MEDEARRALETHLETHRVSDLARAILIVVVLSIVGGWYLGFERASLFGYDYAMNEWNPIWGFLGGAIPLVMGPRLYRWLRARRARRYYTTPRF